MLIDDAGVILAAADHADPDHVACVEVVERTDLLVTTEAAYLIARQLGPAAEAAFFRSVAQGDVAIEALTSADLEGIAELVETYVDLLLGGTDASVIAIASASDRLGSAPLTADVSPSSAPPTAQRLNSSPDCPRTRPAPRHGSPPTDGCSPVERSNSA